MKALLISALALAVGTASLASQAQDGSALHRLVQTLLEKNLPTTLYEGRDIPWEYGQYNLTITKAGTSAVQSDSEQISALLPLNIKLSGNIKKKLFGSDINIACHSEFETQSQLALTPQWQNLNEAKLGFEIPIPEADMDCQGLKLPIKIPLEQMIAKEKPEWEARAETELSRLLTEMGF